MKTAARFIATGLAACALACGPKDTDYDSMAQTALSRAGFENLDANYDADARVVHITGTVRTSAERDRVKEAVEQAVTPSAQVANEVMIERDARTAGDLDSGLSTRLKNLVDEDVVLSATRIEFDVRNGVVTITGRVATDEQKHRVGQMAQNQPGVREVVNSLEVRARS